MKLVRDLKAVFAAVSVVLSAIGVCLLIWPDVSALTVCTVLGVAAVACGIVKLVGYFSNDLYRLAFQFDLAVGVLTILVGALLLLHPEDVLALLPVVVGLVILVESVLRLQTAIDAKHFGMKKWWAILAVSVGGAALGFLLLLRPFESGRALVRLMGLTLLADGVENLLAGLYTIKVPRRSCPDLEVEYTVRDSY